MKQQKGFSLVEVLASLLLVTTLVLSLLQQQSQSKQLLTQLILHELGSHLLDQVDEALLARAPKLPVPPKPYHLDVRSKTQGMVLHLGWWKKGSAMTRQLIHG